MDRRTIWAILLMMAIAVAPAILMKKSAAPPARGGAAAPRDSGAVIRVDSSVVPKAPSGSAADSARAVSRDSTRRQTAVPLPRQPSGSPNEDTVRVTSPLYTYGISTQGARLVEATLPKYRSMAP